MFHFATLLSLMTILSATLRVNGRELNLLYHISSNESLRILDKQSRMSFLSNGNNIAVHFDANHSQDNLPNLYSLLFANDQYMLVGTLERVLNISLSDLTVNSGHGEILWKTNPKFINNCRGFKLSSSSSKLLYKCRNYIRGVVYLNNTLIMCGTNSSMPYCQRYNGVSGGLIGEFNQPQLSTLKRISSNNYLDVDQAPVFEVDRAVYFVNAGSYTIEPTINKMASGYMMGTEPYARLIKTPKGALKNAKFRASFSHGEKVYFFFYETESQMDLKSGLTFKTPFSLIGEVCQNDNGKSSYLENFNRFITFKKASIYCYLPDYKDGFHVKYTEIQAVSKPIRLSETTDDPDNDVFYAIFTFRRMNSVDSALCQYKMSTVQETMTGYFKPVDHDDRITYKKPLSSCQDYKEMGDANLNKYHNERTQNYNYQMEQTVNEPALFAMNGVRFTAIAVDPPNPRNNFNEVIFIGLADGRIIKLLMQPFEFHQNGPKYQQPIVIQEYTLFEYNQAVESLVINSANGKLIAISDEQIKSIDLTAGCSTNADSCASCLDSQDPYCVWSNTRSACLSLADTDLNEDLARISKTSGVNQCTSNGVYTISKLSTYGDSYEANTEHEKYQYSQLNSIRKPSDGSGHLLVAIFLTALLTCLMSVGLTCLLINQRSKMADYLSRHLSVTISSNRSSASSTTSYNHYKTDKYQTNVSEIDSKTAKPRLQNFYDTSVKPLLGISAFSKKNEQRYDTPTVNTNISSSTDCTQHSPNSELTQPKSINDTLSSSNESCCFDPHSMSDECNVHASCDRYSKRPFSSPMSNKKLVTGIEGIETIQISTSLLGANVEGARDANV